MERKVLSLLVANQFGVLTRVSNLFGQRGFNIDSLAVGETENPRFSRITITTHGNEAIINQIKLQLAKLEDVKNVMEIPQEQLFIREVVLVKCEPRSSARFPGLPACGGGLWGTLSDHRGRRLCRRADRYRPTASTFSSKSCGNTAYRRSAVPAVWRCSCQKKRYINASSVYINCITRKRRRLKW